MKLVAKHTGVITGQKAFEERRSSNGYDPVIPLRLAPCVPKRDGRVKPGHDKRGV
jgi:hypothetical protein